MAALFLLSSWLSCDCQCSVALPHGAVDRPECVIVVIPDHTLFAFFNVTAECISRARVY